MTSKIEIKSVTGEVLFSYEKENNTIKDTLEEAARNGVNLDGACLRGANLTGAYLNGAYFDGTYLSNVYVRDGIMLSGVNGIFTVGAIGIVIYNTDKGLYVQCGCFFDTIEKFVSKVQGMHDKAKSRFYMALVDLAKAKYNENN